jgi:hypothetical protein
MIEARIKKGIAAVAAMAAAAAMVVGFAGNGSAASSPLQAFGITSDGRLMAAFYTATPQVLDWVRVPSGLIGDTALIGLDHRVQDGKMYVVGNKGGIYTVTIAAPNVILTKVSQLAIALHGTAFGVDFNPAANRLRVVSDTGQNLRHNVDDGTTVMDTALSSTGVTAVAYTNNDLHPDTATTLFDLNTITDQVVIQSPANNGLLAPTGKLGPDATSKAGFDILADLSNGKTVSNSGFAALISPSGTATFYTVELLTGMATAVGDFPLPISDITIQLDSN